MPDTSSTRLVVTAMLVVTLAACGSDGEGVEADSEAVAVFELPDTVAFPEGIAVDESTGRIYVGNTTDGAVHRSVSGDPTDGFEIFLPADDERDQVVGLRVRDGRLYAAGRRNATLHVHDIESGAEIATLTTPEAERSLLNDIALDAEHAYVTDSFRPVIFRVDLDGIDAAGELEPWLDLTTTSLAYDSGFNLNGIATSSDGAVLLAVQSNTGSLWRVDIATRQVTEVALDGGGLVAGDGLLLDGTELHVVTNRPAAVVRIELDDTLTSGVVVETLGHESLDLPTTVADADGDLYVVNSQLDDSPGEESTPFTITRFADDR